MNCDSNNWTKFVNFKWVSLNTLLKVLIIQSIEVQFQIQVFTSWNSHLFITIPSLALRMVLCPHVQWPFCQVYDFYNSKKATRYVKNNRFYEEFSCNIEQLFLIEGKICLQRLMCISWVFTWGTRKNSWPPHLTENKRLQALHNNLRKISDSSFAFLKGFLQPYYLTWKVSLIIGIWGINPQMGYLF